ncbi:PREDICTED: zinc finger protein 436-like isoform X1 [Cyprinodon variegatus]|uniref:Zinc finger protein 418-like n=1 Tax=Cyprinodon variegatus TaxID=28743 RepID=A0A3Q2GCB6_CYPVA|nr:PREDICTED: zinc finger protein 436-like isoform X1 [Cyprinodon variegatus]
MSAEPLMFPLYSQPHSAAVEPVNSPLSEVETFRNFLSERLTAAVEDILGVFGTTVARYREQIDRQQRELDNLRTGEGEWSRSTEPQQESSWIKKCPENPSLDVPLFQTDVVVSKDVNTSAAPIKSEGVDEDLGETTALSHFNSTQNPDLEAASDERVISEDSDTENSEGGWKDEASLWRSEETVENKDQSITSELQGFAELSQISCQVCGISFQKMGYLVTHASVHQESCGVCGKQMEQNESLKLHLKRHREKSFRCGVCGQSFTLRGNLRIHMRIHSGERPHSCSICGKSFGRRASLVRHVRSHTGEKPFACMYCGHSFTEKGNLTVHLRTHTGERPYRCSMCARSFSQLSSFYKHPCQKKGLICSAITAS